MTKMQTPKALELLKEYLWELDNLRTLHHSNKERWLWKNKVNVVLEAAFGENTDEYEQLNPKIKFGSDGLSDTEEQKYYLRDLDNYETGIVKILQKYEILGFPKEPETDSGKSTIEENPKAFIAHGGETKARNKLQRFLIALGVQPLIIEEEPKEGRSPNEQIEYFLKQANCAVILGTADDKELKDGKLYPRRNVHIEIGRVQERFPRRIVFLLEVGASFPSNISEKLYTRFTHENMDEAFITITRELKAFGILKAVKP